MSPASGTNAGTITVTPNVAGLAPGRTRPTSPSRAGAVAGSPATIPVTLTVDPTVPPALAVAPASLAFGATQGGANPAARTLDVTNTGGGTLSWTASDDAAWLAVDAGVRDGRRHDDRDPVDRRTERRHATRPR